MLVHLKIGELTFTFEVTHYEPLIPATFHDPAEGGWCEFKLASTALAKQLEATGITDQQLEELVYFEATRRIKMERFLNEQDRAADLHADTHF